jgi:hypothetical protein
MGAHCGMISTFSVNSCCPVAQLTIWLLFSTVHPAIISVLSLSLYYLFAWLDT